MGDRSVAIKIPRVATEQVRLRFEREIAASARLQHENIVRVFDRGDAGGVPYLVMEYVEGRSLRQVMDVEHPLTCIRVVRIVRGIAAGLSHAGSRGIVNRDVKPDNVLLSADDVPKILDYGLAVFCDPTSGEQFLTHDGALLGTLAYLAPEQAADPHRVTIRADVYALGCTAFHLLTGRPPFHGEPRELRELHGSAPRPSVRRHRPDVAPELEDLILRMMAVRPIDRPDPAVVMADLDRLIGSTLPTMEANEEVVVGSILPGETPEPDDRLEEPPPITGLGSESSKELTSEIVVGTILLDQDPAEAPPVQTDLDTVAPDANATPPVVLGQILDEDADDQADGDPDVAVLPISAIVDDEAPPIQPPDRKAARPRTRQRSSLRPRLLLAAILLLTGVVGLRYFLVKPLDPVDCWSSIQQDIQQRKWKSAEDALRRFAIDYPDHPCAAEVSFFLEYCEAGQDIFSATGDAEKGLAKLQQIFLDYRDRQEYERYCSDLYSSAEKLIERFLALCERTAAPRHLDGARSAFDLLSTVAQAMDDPSLSEQTEALQRQIASAQTALERTLARNRIFEVAAEIKDPDTPSARMDPAYEHIQGMLRQHPALAKDREVEQAVRQAYQSESRRVQYVPEDDTEFASWESAHDVDVRFMVWDSPAPAGDPGGGQVFLGLARGVLYAFSPEGRHLWSRRLGFDSERLPLAIRPSPTSPEAFLAVSTLDNALAALDKHTGKPMWEYRAGDEQELAAPLTISRWREQRNQPEIVRGLLPTANGEIHVLELARGRRIGRFLTGFPMTVGGTYDPETRLAFFPAERKRVFAIDPATIERELERRTLAGSLVGDSGEGVFASGAQAVSSVDGEVVQPARSMLFTGHSSGALRSAPIVIGQYLILTEASDLDHTIVRAFQIQRPDGFLDSRAGSLTELTLRGWSWFTPPATPDRITVVTDQGDLGVCGVNLDNPHEALYLLIKSSPGECPRLPIREPARTLGIYSEEHLLWLMADGVLQHWALDILHQKAVRLWPQDVPAAAVTGIPLHEAHMDREGDRIYVTTKSLDGRQIMFSAVDAATGDRLWQRQLGVCPVGDLIRWNDTTAVLVDQTGRLLHFDVSVANGQQQLRMTPGADGPLDRDGSGLLRLRCAEGRTFLLLTQEGGSRLIVKRLAEGAEPSSWREISLPGVRLQGRPAVAGNSLVVPASDGRLHRLPWDGSPGATANELPFPWKSPLTLAPTDAAEVYALAEDELWLIDGNRARCLKFGEQDGIRQWKQQGGEFLASAPLTGAPVVLPDDEFLFLADVRGALYRVSRSQPEAEGPRWFFEGRLTAEPLVMADRLLMIRDHRQLVCWTIEGTPPKLRLAWTSDQMAGRICGQPIPLNTHVMVTDETGMVTVWTVADGRLARSLTLERGAVPAAAAVPLGHRRILVPLADGTLLWHNLTATGTQQVAEVGR
jgi:serine/threonine protein kinase